MLKRTALVVALASILVPSPALANHRPHRFPLHQPRHRTRSHVQPLAEWRGTLPQVLAVLSVKAHELWNATPCNGQYSVHFVNSQELAALTGLPSEPKLDGFWAGEVAAASGWDSPTGPNQFTSPPATWTNCVMSLNAANWPEVYPEPFADQVDWIQDCSVFLHEWGHLTGHPHSDVAGEPPEPPGMTHEQLIVMRELPYDTGNNDLHRCGWEP